MTDARSSRVAISVLVTPVPDARASRLALSVLVKVNGAAGTTFYWWDGSALQLINKTLSGWWDGAAIQPINWPVCGWWDGAAIQPLA